MFVLDKGCLATSAHIIDNQVRNSIVTLSCFLLMAFLSLEVSGRRGASVASPRAIIERVARFEMAKVAIDIVFLSTIVKVLIFGDMSNRFEVEEGWCFG